MKQLSKIFSVASLFEDSKYVTIFNDFTGKEAGHYYKTGKKFIAYSLSTGKKAEVKNQFQAEQFIKGTMYFSTIPEEDTRDILKWEIYLLKKCQQVRRLWTTKPTKHEADRKAKEMYCDYPRSEYEVQLIPIYNTSQANKNQIKIDL